jgi:hypothetical protein
MKSHSVKKKKNTKLFIFLFLSFYITNMSNKQSDTDSDVSELDPKELSEALDKYAPQLGYAEDPETPLTADSFPSKSGGKPVKYRF